MAFETYGLTQMLTEIINGTITARLHTGNPGNAGTANLIATTTLDRPAVTGAASWTLTDITNGRRAQVNADLDFGNASHRPSPASTGCPGSRAITTSRDASCRHRWTSPTARPLALRPPPCGSKLPAPTNPAPALSNPPQHWGGLIWRM